MWNRVSRNIASVATILLLTGIPTQAAPVVVSEVVQVLSNYQSATDLRLRNFPVNVDQRERSRVSSFQVADWALNPSSDSLLAGVAVASDQQKVEVIAQGDVEGTVCDCGEILVADGFPKWPLIFLAGIPFIFIRDCETCDSTPPIQPPVFPTPTPPTQTTPTPEPASLLLFGTGLAAFGAGLRRHYARKKKLAQTEASDEGGSGQ